MSPEFGVLLTPLLMLPGVALLILSTSARYAQVHAEFHHLEGASHGAESSLTLHRLMRRAHLFRAALVGLYCAVCGLALASLVGGVFIAFAIQDRALVPIVALTSLSVACILFSALQLVRESTHSLHIIRDHYQKISKTPQRESSRT